MTKTLLVRPLLRASSRHKIFAINGASHSIRCRYNSTLPDNPHIYVFPSASQPGTYLLTLLSTAPPTPSLAIGTTPTVPPTPSSLTENPHFLSLLHATLRDHAHQDPHVIAQAKAFASSAGSSLGSGGAFFPQQQQQNLQRARRRGGPGYGYGGGGGGAGAASDAQGGAGASGGGRGGWIHVSDGRRVPDFGRTADPEDIFGSLEVDAEGKFVEPGGRYQASGSYRVVTREGVLGLSEFLRAKLVERLREAERMMIQKKEVGGGAGGA